MTSIFPLKKHTLKLLSKNLCSFKDQTVLPRPVSQSPELEKGNRKIRDGSGPLGLNLLRKEPMILSQASVLDI